MIWRPTLLVLAAVIAIGCGGFAKTRADAEAGDPVAQNELGTAYIVGREVKRDEVAAASWFRKAAEQGNAEAQNNLGWLYTQGNGVEQSDTKAVEWYRKAAAQGHALAQGNLGYSYQKGRGVEQSDAKALEWYEKSAAQGEPKTQNNLAYFLATRPGASAKDLERALEFAQAAHDAMPSFVRSTDTLACVLLKLGRPDEAIPLLLTAARAKPPNPLYLCHLGLAYRDIGRNDDAIAQLRRALATESFDERAECDAALIELLTVPKKTAQRSNAREGTQSSFATAPQNSTVVARPPWSGVSARPSV